MFDERSPKYASNGSSIYFVSNKPSSTFSGEGTFDLMTNEYSIWKYDLRSSLITKEIEKGLPILDLIIDKNKLLVQVDKAEQYVLYELQGTDLVEVSRTNASVLQASVSGNNYVYVSRYRGKEFLFEPNEALIYNNSGYFFLGLIIEKVKKGLLFYTKGKTGIIAIEDVINCMSLLMNSNVNGERFTLVSENVNFNSLLTMVAKGLNVKPPSIYANKWLTSLGWRVDWLSSKIFFRKRKFTRATSVSSHSIDTYENTKFITELNYSFIKMDEYLINLAQEYKQL